MSATECNNSASNHFSHRLRNFAGGRKNRRKSAKNKKPLRHNLQFEGLENREMMAVYSLWFTGNVLMVMADNTATDVTVSQVDSNIRIRDIGANKSWDYAASSIGMVAFQGGAGNDRFVNNVLNLRVRAMGGAGDDYLEGYGGNDLFSGGDGNDTLIGYGGNDQLIGNNGNDLIRGMEGDDSLSGGAGNDHIDGGANKDVISGGDGADILLGGIGDDELYGDGGNDRLNGQAGVDKLWAGADNDIIVAIDDWYGELVDSGTGADTMWIDDFEYLGQWGHLIFDDDVMGATASDIVQRVRSFANRADRTLDGDSLTDPTDSGAKLRFNNVVTAGNTQGSNPLFDDRADGPTIRDITQGNLGDCWLTAGLGGIATQSSNILRQNVVDFDDGTYGVRLGDRFYRVDNELPVWSAANGAISGNLQFAKLGAQNSMWVAVVEKAFTHHRSGANTYASLISGTITEVFKAFRMKNVYDFRLSAYTSATVMANDLFAKWTQRFSLVVGVAANTVPASNHAFTIAGFTFDAAGALSGIILRNPWGVDGLDRFNAFAAANNSGNAFDGVFTVTPNQLYNSMGWIGMAQA